MGDLAKALAAFQAELPKVGKGSTNTHFGSKYADLADVSLVVLPLLGKHGLSFSSKPTLDEAGRFVLAYQLRHESGDADGGSYPLPATGTPQQIGSAITYARRYALQAMTGVAADEDDDGNATRDLQVTPETHEHAFDPAEQEQMREQYEAEIEKASAEELDEIGKRIARAHRTRMISPNTFRRLNQAGARRRAELNGTPAMPAALDVP